MLSNVRTLAPQLPCDCVPGTPRALEAICLKALAKQPGDRYPSVKALADDVLHFQADEPTTVYREPLAARAWRWARRRRVLVTSLVAALVVAVPILVAGIVLLDRSEGRERNAREQAEQARKDEEAARERGQTNYRRSLRAADAMAEELARGIRPIAGTQSKTVIEILDRTKQITDDLLADPDPTPEVLESKARMLVQFTELYRDVNRSALARQSAEQSIALFNRLLELRPDERRFRIERAKARNRLGWVLYDQGHFADSLATFWASIAELEVVGAEADPALAAQFLASGYTFEGNVLALYGDHTAAEKAYLRGLDIRRKAHAAAPNDLQVRMQFALSLERYGAFLASISGGTEGLPLLREGRNEMKAVCAAEPWDARLHFQYSKLLSTLGEWATDESEALACVDEGEKLVERFVHGDPDNIHWQRESRRHAYCRLVVQLRVPSALPIRKLHDLRAAEYKMLGKMVAVTARSAAEDPDSYWW